MQKFINLIKGAFSRPVARTSSVLKALPDSELKSLANIVPDSGKSYADFRFKDGAIGETYDLILQNREVHVNLIKREIPFNVSYEFADGLSVRHLFPPKNIVVSEIIEFRIPVRQKFWLRMSVQRFHEQDATEIQAGVDWLDRKYLIHTNQREAAQQFLHKICGSLHFAEWPCSFDKLEIIHGEICLTLNQPGRWRINRSHINFFLEELLILAGGYEREEILILSSVLAQNYSLCPYCRSRLDDHSQSVVSCQNCSTVIHESCWNENGLCTTWGCGSIVATPTRR